MTQLKKLQLLLAIQLVLVIGIVYVFSAVSAQEVIQLKITRAQILIGDVKQSLVQAGEMSRIATGPNTGDEEYLKNQHAELLAATSTIESLDARLSAMQNLIDIASLAAAKPTEQLQLLDVLAEKTYSDYSYLKIRLRSATMMDSSSYDYDVTQTFVHMNERSLAALEAHIALIESNQ